MCYISHNYHEVLGSLVLLCFLFSPFGIHKFSIKHVLMCSPEKKETATNINVLKMWGDGVVVRDD